MRQMNKKTISSTEVTYFKKAHIVKIKSWIWGADSRQVGEDAEWKLLISRKVRFNAAFEGFECREVLFRRVISSSSPSSSAKNYVVMLPTHAYRELQF